MKKKLFFSGLAIFLMASLVLLADQQNDQRTQNQIDSKKQQDKRTEQKIQDQKLQDKRLENQRLEQQRLDRKRDNELWERSHGRS